MSRRILYSFLSGVILLLTSCDRQPQVRQLIISADDAGMCSAVNLATTDATERGLVTSVSVMSCCPAFADFANYAVRHPTLDCGIHLTLTCDVPDQPWGPVLPLRTVPSLVDENGHFWPNNDLVSSNANINEAERELRAQIDKASSSGIHITHLDNHMFVLYCRRDLFELYVQLALDYRLPIRIEKEPERASRSLLPLDDARWQETFTTAVRRLAAAGLPILDRVEYENYGISPSNKRVHYLQVLRDLKPGITELVTHCAYSLPSSVHPPDVDRREADARFLMSDEAGEEISRLRITLRSWKTLPRFYSESGGGE